MENDSHEINALGKLRVKENNRLKYIEDKTIRGFLKLKFCSSVNGKRVR